MAIDTEPGDLRHLDRAIQKVEFKLTVLPKDERKVQSLLAQERADPERRRVYFYDTRELALYARDLVLRSRVIEGDADDSTVKLRPVDLSRDHAAWREIGGIRVELDVVGSKHVASVKLDGEPDPGEIDDVAAGRRSVGSLFSGRQEELVQACTPDGLSSHDLEVLGPVDARKWDLENLDDFPHTLCVEEWSLPDASRFIELSFKVSPDEADDAQSAFHGLLAGLRIGLAGDQIAKTPRVLEFFAGRLGDRP
jgi:hypothetical protein